VALAGVTGLCKGLLPLYLLVFLVPVARLGRPRRYAVWVVATFAAGERRVGLVGVVRPRPLCARFTPEVSPKDQNRFHGGASPRLPPRRVSTWRTIGLEYAGNLVGKLGWRDTPLPRALVASYLGMLLVVSVLHARENVPSRPLPATVPQRPRAGADLPAHHAWMYVTWTPVGDRTFIRGLQERYFVPVMFLIFVVWQTRCGSRFFPVVETGVDGLPCVRRDDHESGCCCSGSGCRESAPAATAPTIGAARTSLPGPHMSSLRARHGRDVVGNPAPFHGARAFVEGT